MSTATLQIQSELEEKKAEFAQKQPLNTCVAGLLEEYFNTLGGHDPVDLYDMVLREVEQPLLEKVMGFTRGNQSKAAEILGINRGTLRKKLKLYGIR